VDVIGYKAQLILKVFDRSGFKAFLAEAKVLLKLKERGFAGMGFPEVKSCRWCNNRAEILMQALGPNLGKLYKQCPAKEFSISTCLRITI
jgi:hypothetical protein